MKTFRISTDGNTVNVRAESFRQAGEYVSFYVASRCTALVRLPQGGFVVEV